MDSHITLPKCILKQFADEKQSLHCFDVAKKEYRKARARSFNTEEGHYSDEVELILNKEIETPLGTAISIIKQHCDEDHIKLKNYEILKKYMHSLLCRSLEMKQTVKENTIFGQFMDPQLLHDWSAIDGLDKAQQDKWWDDYSICLLTCSNGEEFVLPQQGYCDFLCYGQPTIIMPLTPTIACCLYADNNGRGCQVEMVENFIEKVNSFSLEKQIKKGYGCVISSKKEIINNLVKNYCIMKQNVAQI